MKIDAPQQRDVVAAGEHEHRGHDRDQIPRADACRREHRSARRDEQRDRRQRDELAEVAAAREIGDEVRAGDEHETGHLRPPAAETELHRQPGHAAVREAEPAMYSSL